MSHVFLTGFMGAGKSTVGALVAERLGRPFLDLDAVIGEREGASVADIFSARGETGFREAEHAALVALVERGPSVVATGGGAVLREDNQALLRRHGTVVYLAVSPEEAMARLGDAGDRPLLAGEGLAAARSILDSRLALYRATADAVVDTGGRTPAEVAEAVIAALGAGGGEHVVRVGAPDAPDAYDIVSGEGLIDRLGEYARELVSGRSIALVSDTAVWALYGERAAASLRDAGFAVSTHIVPAGELSKSWERAGALLEEFAGAGIDRASAAVALGGGVVGDLTGFCAATYMRGIPVLQVPTTLLAQVDSAIGGKTGVDLAAGKNLAGAFWPPRLVLADTASLQTLPPAEWTNGLVETAKAALLDGGLALADFERDLPSVVGREPHAVASAVRAAAAFKARVVSEDLRESGVRECLNLGHTLGHALERLTGYATLPHGLAVAEGMRFAADLAARAIGAPAETAVVTRRLLEEVGAGEVACRAVLDRHFDRLRPGDVLAAMKADKKSRDGVVRFVLLETPGCWAVEAVEDAILLEELARWVSRPGEGGV